MRRQLEAETRALQPLSETTVAHRVSCSGGYDERMTTLLRTEARAAQSGLSRVASASRVGASFDPFLSSAGGGGGRPVHPTLLIDKDR